MKPAPALRHFTRAILACLLLLAVAAAPLRAQTLAALTSPAPGSTLTASSATFSWSAGSGADQYWLDIGTTVDGTNVTTGSTGTGLQKVVANLTPDGRTFFVRLWSHFPSGWQSNRYQLTALDARAVLSTPAPGSTLNGTTATFTWTAGSGVDQYWLDVGITAGGTTLATGSTGTSLQKSVSNLPSDNRPVFVTLWSHFPSGWTSRAYQLTAADGRADLSTPAPGSTLSGSSASFTWTAGTGVDQYWLDVATTVNGTNLFTGSTGTARQRTVAALPTNSGPIFIRLWSHFPSGWTSRNYQVTASAPVTPVKAALSTPAPGSTLPATSATFTWTAGAAIDQYWLDVGSVAGGTEISTGSTGTALQKTVTTLPADGRPLFVRVWSHFSTGWVFNDYQLTALEGRAALTSPTPGSTLAGASVTFVWTAGTGVDQYWLDVGTTVNGTNISTGSTGTAQQKAVTGIPTNGSTVFVRLWSHFASGWTSRNYQVTAAAPVPPVPPVKAVLSTPAPYSTLTATSATFTWTAGAAIDQYWLDIGSAAGGTDISTGSTGTALQKTVTTLPADGRTLFVRVWSHFSTGWLFNDYFLNALDGRAELTSPGPGSTLTGTSVTFNWTAGTGVDEYRLDVGTTLNGTNIFTGSTGTAQQKAVTGIPNRSPANGYTVYVRLWSHMASGWSSRNYSYSAPESTAGVKAVLSTPAPQSTLASTSATFTWTAGTGVDEYFLYVGSDGGKTDIFSGSTGTVRQKTLTGLPGDGRLIYVTLWSHFSTGWAYNDYLLYAVDVRAMITSPTIGSTLSGPSVTFSWTAGLEVDQYFLDVGSSQGGTQFSTGSTGLTRSKTVSGLPQNGSTVFVRVWSHLPQGWLFVDASYTASDSTNVAATLTAPAPGSTIALDTDGFQTTCSWTAGTNVDYYVLTFEAPAPASRTYFNSGPIPANGARTLKVTIPPLVSPITIALFTQFRNGASARPTFDFPVVAPSTPVGPTVAGTVFDSALKLVGGATPLQPGLASGTLDPRTATVIRGRVLTSTGGQTSRARSTLAPVTQGAPVAGATVTVTGQPEYGQTVTAADGTFLLAVNTGYPVVVRVDKSGFPPVQRTVAPPPQMWEIMPDIVLTPYDATSTVVDFTAPITVARGSTVTDADGTRRATLLFTQGTTASMVLSGGQQQSVSTLHVRATELTVGANGPHALPGDQPPASAYTYVSELSADEAVAAGATKVLLSKPAFLYSENYLNFPVGGHVPGAGLDRSVGLWFGATDGRVVKILTNSGGTVTLDLDGSGSAAGTTALAAAGITSDELAALSGLYAVGQQLWRLPVPFLAPRAASWPAGGPVGAPAPKVTAPVVAEACRDRDSRIQVGGEAVDLPNRIAHVDLPIAGTAYNLHYTGDRVPGRTFENRVSLPVIGATVPPNLVRVEVRTNVAGKLDFQTFPAQANQTYTYTWDGTDGTGAVAIGERPARIQIAYVYAGNYQAPINAVQGWGAFSGVPISSASRQEIVRTQIVTTKLGTFNVVPQKLGGWMIDAHSIYDTDQSAVCGDGSKCKGEKPKLKTKSTALSCAVCMVGPDGKTYFGNTFSVNSQDADASSATRVAGGGSSAYADGLPARNVNLSNVNALTVGRDKSLYLGITSPQAIRRVTPDGIIRTVGGGGTPSDGLGDGLPALQAALRLSTNDASLEFGPDGSLYVGEVSGRVRRIDPGGVIQTIVGPATGSQTPEGTPAALASFVAGHISVGPDGSLYLLVGSSGPIQRIGPDGRVETVAGGANFGQNGEGVPATQVYLSIRTFAVDRDGNIFVAEASRIRKVGTDGIIKTIAGTGEFTIQQLGEGGDPAAARLFPNLLKTTPEGDVVFTNGSFVLRCTEPTVAPFSGKPFAVASGDGAALRRFNAHGRHLLTQDTETGATLQTFGYDAAGLLTSITDGDGNVTTIGRDGSGNATTITAPGGQVTTLTTNGNGYLTSFAGPGGTHAFTYGTSGLLLTHQEPRGGTTTFDHDSAGLLNSVRLPGGGTYALATSPLAVTNGGGKQATLATPLGQTVSRSVEVLSNGDRRDSETNPAGASKAVLSHSGSVTRTSADGTVVAIGLRPDPRFGRQAETTEGVTVTTPGGVRSIVTENRTATLLDPADPLSVETLTDTFTVDGNASTSVFDRSQLKRTDTSAAGRVSVTQLDSRGRVVSLQVDPNVAPYTLTYDAQGRVSAVSLGDRTATCTYDAKNRLATITDAANNVTRYQYDQDDRLTQATLPDLGLDRFSYDLAGNLLGFLLPGGTTHALAYDADGQLVAYTPPANAALGLLRDADGRVSRVTLPAGRTIVPTYDAGGRVTTLVYDAATVSTSYTGATDRVALQTRTPTGGGTAQLLATLYDGSLITRRTFTGPASGQYSYRYGTGRVVMGYTLDTNPETTMSRDADRLVTALGPFTWTRGGPAGAVSRITDGTGQVDYGYDGQGRLSTRTLTVNGTQVFRVQLTFDNVGRVSQKVETAGGVARTFAYTYDSRNRLTVVARDGVTIEVYAYDTDDNRSSRKLGTAAVESATYDGQGRLASRGSLAYQFNADGFLAARGTDAFQYSATGELVQATVGGVSRTYGYDGSGCRVARTDGAGTYQYLYSALGGTYQVDATRNPAGQLTQYFYDDTGALFAFRRAGVMTYVGSDQVGSPRVIAGATGAVQRTVDYDSWGNVVLDSAPSFDLAIGFAGGLTEPATGLVRFGKRDYEPASGRWTARDPILFDGGQRNLYAYVSDDPVGQTDPSGLKPDLNIIDSGLLTDGNIKAAESFPQPAGTFTIAGHGDGGGTIYSTHSYLGKGTEYTPEALLKLILGDPKLAKNFNAAKEVRIYACLSGVGGDKSFAKQFADLSRKATTGIRGYLDPTPDGLEAVLPNDKTRSFKGDEIYQRFTPIFRLHATKSP